ncbi:serine protease inhibitor 77Ba-like [Pieris rapae]|uniref:serine protease inhibitor 77Ba-like n=1 Tax=Pieris rapae TaxID=64459 RepID=UPI001E27CCA9|nr:serine protease inhibitor 77Ba-like [Pieris rapae]
MTLANLILFLGILVSCQCFSDRENNFTTEFLYFTQIETAGHAAVSPYGIWNMLSQVKLLTAGNTKKQLQRALFLPKSCIELSYGLKNLSDVILGSNTGNTTLFSRNYVVIDENLLLNYIDFERDVNVLGMNIIPLDLHERDSAVIVANRLMYDEGQEVSESFQIPELIKTGEVDLNGMTLANVNRFHQVWRNKFTSVRVEKFYNEKSRPIGKVNMMFQKVNAACANIKPLESQVLELPYGDDGKYAMLLIKPYPNIKVNDVFEKMTKFTYGQIQNILNIQPPTVVNVKLPRFKISTDYALNVPLNKMGVFDLFEKKYSEFYGVSQNSLFVQTIVQHVSMVVNEFGLRTAEVLPARRWVKFTADKPFLYFVIEKTTDIIVVGGVYSEPTIY